MADYDFAKLSVDMERVIHKYVQTEQLGRSYGTDIMLSRVEIHTIETIGEQAGLSVTQLAKIKGITKGAASQMIYKLVSKGLVEKRVSKDSDSQLSLYLTEKGQKAFEGHKKFHETTQKKFFVKLREIPEEALLQMHEILEAFEEMMDEDIFQGK